MIKSALMYRKTLLILVLVLLLYGCGQRRPPDVEHFQGEVVATLQKPILEALPELVTPSLPPSGDTELTPQVSQPIPTKTPVGTPSPTLSNLQSTNYPSTTSTSTLSAYPEATPNLSQTPTSTLGVPAWQGTWKIWYQAVNGGYLPAELTIQVNGTRLTATANIESIEYTFKGNFMMEGAQVEGEWQTDTTAGSFWWRMNSADTFVGSRENRFGFCGNRATAVQPNPCREVPQN